MARDAGLAGGAAFARAGFADPPWCCAGRRSPGRRSRGIARPLQIQRRRIGGVLTLLAEPGAALFLGHESRALTARINAYLGRRGRDAG